MIVPALVVGTIELLSDTILDPYLPFPWDTVVVTIVVAVIAGTLAALAFRRIDALTTSLEARNAEVEARAETASALHAVTLAIASLSDLDAILQTTVDSARSLLRADLSLLTLAGPDAHVRLRASSGQRRRSTSPVIRRGMTSGGSSSVTGTRPSSPRRSGAERR